ncbi:MAG: YraN family protein [Deltaproteobacteria bacterium]|nr:YraN family protein [Deltaproteobacteria bacterium]
MTIERISKGKKGEDAAAAFLVKDGYKIVERNFRCPLGEIDIVAVDKGVLVFVEVKTRSSNKFGLPEEAVNRRKQHQMTKSAQFYLSRKKLFNSPARFDVVAVILSGEKEEVRVIRNAFEVS